MDFDFPTQQATPLFTMKQMVEFMLPKTDGTLAILHIAERNVSAMETTIGLPVTLRLLADVYEVATNAEYRLIDIAQSWKDDVTVCLKQFNMDYYAQKAAQIERSYEGLDEYLKSFMSTPEYSTIDNQDDPANDPMPA